MTRASRDTALTTRAAPPALPLRDAQQHLVQPGWRRLPLRTPSGERTEPLGRLRINRVSRAGRLVNHGFTVAIVPRTRPWGARRRQVRPAAAADAN